MQLLKEIRKLKDFYVKPMWWKSKFYRASKDNVLGLIFLILLKMGKFNF